MPKQEHRRLTAKELLEALQQMPDDTEIHLEELSFHKLKKRGDRLLQIEFNEALDRTTDTHIIFQKCPL